MVEFVARTALRALTPQVDTWAGLEIRERPDLSLAWLARRRDGDLGAFEAALGRPLPAPGHAVSGARLSAISLSPDQWLIAGPWEIAFSQAIKDLVGPQGSVCDQSDGWVVFEIRGIRTADLMERLAPADIRAMTPGMTTPTPIANLRCLVERRDDGINLLGPRNSARSLHNALIEAARALL